MQRRLWMAAAAGLGLGTASVWWGLRSRSTARAETTSMPAVAEPAASAPPASGAQVLWATRLPQAGGGELVLAELKGQPLLVNFWATWCAPCVKELPLLDRFAREQAGRIAVVGIAVDRHEAVQTFLAKSPVTFRVGVAGFAGGTLARELGNAQGGLPFSVALDRQGRLLDRKLGETHAEDLQAWALRLAG